MVVWVALAGSAGAISRYLVHRAVQGRVSGLFPFGTVVVNITGSFALGFLVGLVLYQGVSADARTIAGTGFIGAYTTFSSFVYESFGLVEDHAPTAALVNAVGSVLAGLAAATLGLVLAGLL
jgi:CrcB protein